MTERALFSITEGIAKSASKALKAVLFHAEEKQVHNQVKVRLKSHVPCGCLLDGRASLSATIA
ncbi:hypothetical protein TIFTF001_047263 [Ficus carica]|uniref:Uncharacterized protein n=1 Tax=Ficus carica TaxID=3494 RepID=A0AA87YYB2_FICCA|nr:hypothetical protein TIFTF001_047263 [Ficus carica]